MGIITSRATLLVLAVLLVLCSATAESMPPSPSPTPSLKWWCRRVIEPFGPCDHASCKVSCSKKYDGEGVCIGKPEGCQCTYCPARAPYAGDDGPAATPYAGDDGPAASPYAGDDGPAASPAATLVGY